MTNEELTRLLRDCLGDGTGRDQRYIELGVGGIDEPSLEPFLYQLLGVFDSTDLLFGVSTVDTGDLEFCRAEHGDSQFQVSLAPEAYSALNWEIWQAPARHLQSGALAGASLVLPAHAAGWVILAESTHGNLMLFPTRR